MQQEKQYDYIIAGAGCAGLSLLVRLIVSGKFSGKRILLIDREDKNKNDRTWCFWETQPGLFEEIVYRRWDKALFHALDFSRQLSLSPYQYKLIRGIDFYSYSLDFIRKQANIDILIGTVMRMQSGADGTFINVDGRDIHADYIFNSTMMDKPVLGNREYLLLQHFSGWVIETNLPSFDAATATLMDFRVGQQHGTSFVYVMPFSATRALVEYTLFSKSVLKPGQYDEELEKYIHDFLATGGYTILEKEKGVIPMTNHRFPLADHHIINIGTAGGQTKASSGYTFRFIQKHTAAIVTQLEKYKHPFLPMNIGKKRFGFYDGVLLNILHAESLPGRDIFSALFRKNKPQQVLRFLDNESTLTDELKIISSLPKWPFLKAAMKQL